MSLACLSSGIPLAELKSIPGVTGFLILFGFMSFLCGAAMGSGMNCFADRYVSHVSWLKVKKSYCPSCGHDLSTFDLIPVFSYAFLGGKCRYCKTKIRPRYFVCELLMGLAFTLSFVLHLDNLTVSGIADMFCQWIFFCCLLPLSLIDLDTFEIPNRLIIIPACVRAVYVWFFGYHVGPFRMNGFLEFREAGLSAGSSVFKSFLCVLHCAGGGIAVGAVLLIISLIMDKILKKDSMGGGDIKLFACVGMWFSLPAVIIVIIISCIIGLFFAIILMRGGEDDSAGEAESDAQTNDNTDSSADEINTESSENPADENEDEIPDKAFPFGPSIAAAAVIGLFCAEKLVSMYLGLFI